MVRSVGRSVCDVTRLLLVALVLGTGCVPRAHLALYDAPDLVLPDPLKRLGVVSTVDGSHALAAEQAVAEAVATLQAAPGFSAVWVQGSAPGAVGELPAEAVVGLCAAADVDALVVLEALSSDTDLVIEQTQAADEEHEALVSAQRTGRVHTTWRLLDGQGQSLDLMRDVVSADRWISEGSKGNSGVPDVQTSLTDLARSAGTAYGRRLVPSHTSVVRDYYVGGEPRMRLAARHLRRAEWEVAMELWDDVARSDLSATTRAHALYDLGLGWEVLGRPLMAVKATQRALALHDTPRIRRYLEVLREQRTELRPLRHPLALQEGSETP